MPVMYHSLLVEENRFVCPTALLAFVELAQLVFNVPLVLSVPDARNHCTNNELALSLSKAPVVSAGKLIVFLSHVLALSIV